MFRNFTTYQYSFVISRQKKTKIEFIVVYGYTTIKAHHGLSAAALGFLGNLSFRFGLAVWLGSLG